MGDCGWFLAYLNCNHISHILFVFLFKRFNPVNFDWPDHFCLRLMVSKAVYIFFFILATNVFCNFLLKNLTNILIKNIYIIIFFDTKFIYTCFPVRFSNNKFTYSCLIFLMYYLVLIFFWKQWVTQILTNPENQRTK